ncbi:MAG: hypothetical protein V2A70_09560 [Candidatus Omnitrophota bacterium]
MADMTQLIVVVKQRTAALVLADFSDPVELQQFFKSLSELRFNPQIKEFPDLGCMIVSAVAAAGMYKKSLLFQCGDISFALGLLTGVFRRGWGIQDELIRYFLREV